MLFLIGFGLTVAGGVMLILYMNLIPAGLTWTGYWQFVIKQAECLLFFVGIILMLIGLPRISHRFKDD
ncbi:hypothetical protein SAMN04488134_10882 [Amphibacillus marinus]|uniref:Uncharacterized protein n=1 Tax=Amphibacillus marinus TaxID=872970 RepID=A0A1H8Q9I9_9BACI|nr:hypothetical protein [Amphibacillus marinus]SEO50594.1 hypothetical protein SAMN04488134_10882 [Amphibacillus marinus]